MLRLVEPSMSTAKMLRYIGSNADRRGCLPLNGDMEPFVSARPARPRICRRATTSAALAVAGVEASTLVQRRDAVASLPRRHVWSVGLAGQAEDASDASSASHIFPTSLTWAYASLRKLLSYLTAFPAGLT
jgi:hypothetical protein